MTYITSEELSDLSVLAKGEYEECIFRNCHFLQTDLSGFIFTDCTFIECDLSNAQLIDTAFRDVVFKNCKMIGLQFNDCRTFSLSFRFKGCILDYSSFYKLQIKKTNFEGCRMTEVDFTEAVLSESLFEDVDLSGAVFDHCNLDKVDFTSAKNFAIDPELNSIRKAKFSTTGLVGLLYKYNIVVH